MENSERRRSSRITAKNEKRREKESFNRRENRNKGKVKESIDLDEDMRFLLEFESESDHDKNDEPYVPSRRRKTTNNHKTPKKRKRNGGRSSTSRTNVSSRNGVPERNDHQQNVSNLPQRGDQNELHAEAEAEPDNPEMVPSSDKRPAASPSGESGQHTTTAADASSSPEFAGENINGTHSSALVEENNSTAQEPAAAKTRRASNQNLSFGEPFYGENSTPCLASDRHDQTNDKGKKVHQTIPAIVLDQSPNAELGCSDAPASGSRPSSLHLEGANTSCWSNPKNSLSSGLDLNLAPDEQGGDLQCLMSTNMNQPPQHSNTVLPFGYSDLQRGVGLLNPMGPFPMQQPNLLSAELLVPSGGRFIMEGRRMRNLDLNQPPPQEAQNEVENHNLRD